MKDLTRFINEELKPRFYSYIPQIFPELRFKLKGNKYLSPLHADGTEGSGYREDRCVVTEREPAKVFDNPRQEATDIITLFMQLNQITEVWEAVNRLCDIVGVQRPEYTQEQKESYKKKEQQRTALEASLIRQKEALFAPEGKAVLDFMLSRGWTESEIREAELGYISTEEATTIQAQRSIGDFYTLSIPLRSGSTLYGFKFRTIQNDLQGKDKYTYLWGTDKKTNLFNLTGIQQKDGTIVVVEGELDALHAQARGLNGVVATGGGKLTDELLAVATGRGINRITLLFDKDAAGEKYVKESIETANKRGISVLVATFPEGETLPDGKAVHDIDEYLRIHTTQDLQNLIENAELGSKYLLGQIIREEERKCGNEGLTDGKEVDLRYKVIELANNTPNEVERELVFNSYSALMNIDGKEAFSPEALRAVADRKRAELDTLKKREETGKALNEATELFRRGNVEGALRKMEETKDLRQIGDREKYGDLLRVPTREARIAKFKEKPEALKTSYSFKHKQEENQPIELPFVLPSGALTILAAPTSHGKSTFLRNLAIDIAKRYRDKSVLYFTFEESEEDVLAQFTNTYIGMQLHAQSKKYSQTDSIIDYYKTGEPNYIAKEKKDEFLRKELEFSSEFLDNGKIRIYYRDYNLETLIEALEYAVRNIPTKAIFIDYIQILRSEKHAKQPRAEQLKEICISLKDFSVKYKMPVVLAAQLNREANTPLRMNNTQMAESSDIEKAANTIICLWNSNFKPSQYGKNGMSQQEEKEIKELEAQSFKIGKEGKLFALVTKMRGSRGVGMYSVLDHIGYSGKIKENYNPEEQDTKGEQQELPFTEEKKRTDIDGNELPF